MLHLNLWDNKFKRKSDNQQKIVREDVECTIQNIKIGKASGEMI